MVGNCSECGVDLAALKAEGFEGHVCDRKPITVEREFITVYAGPSSDAPGLDLMHGKRQRIVVFAKLAVTQPPGLPEGLVAIELPPNCYIDPSAAGEFDDPADKNQRRS